VRPKAQTAAGPAAAPRNKIDYTQAHNEVVALNRTGKLNDSIVNRFAVRGEYTHVVAAIALKADVKVEAIEPLLEMLLSGRGPGDVRAIDEIRAQFTRARRHEIAIPAALRAALAAVFEKLDPDELESQLGRRAKGAAAADMQIRLWNRYRELFRATIQTGEAGLPAVFLAAFARAYESVTAGGNAETEGPPD